jgi:putative ATPase
MVARPCIGLQGWYLSSHTKLEAPNMSYRRMLTAGEDPQYIARRLIVVASEDVGLADNHALPLAVATMAAVQHVGMPECRINLAHCVTYLAEASKSTRPYEAYKRVR